jgi:soluble lytic murein transglycosylase
MILIRRAGRAAKAAAAAFILTLSAPAWTAAQDLPGPQDAARFAPALAAAEDRDWAAALALAETVGDPAARDVILWRQLADGEGSFAAYADFLERRPDWPLRARLRRFAEERLPADAARVRAFFAGEPPLTGEGALALASAFAAQGRVAEARAEAARAWRELSLTYAQEQALLAAYGPVIAPHHAERLEMLLWRGLSGEATRMLDRVPAGLAALGRARIQLRAGARGVNALIDRVPPEHADDPGLAFERFRWRHAKGLREGAEEMILARSDSAAALGRPEAWADRRRALVREAERDGRARTAYLLAARHHLRPAAGYDYADLEWLAGWIALRRLDDPAAAAQHFHRFLAAVGTPISLGRGWYWLGRAREAAGDAQGAREAWAEGARWQTSFYGQLAAERAGAPADPALAGTPPPTDWREAAILSHPLVRAGALLHHAGDRRRSHWLLTHAARLAPTPRAHAALAQLGLALDRPEIAVRAAKAAARDGLVLPTPYYPVVDLAGASGPVPPELALAIARQESEMNPQAISHAGARGLMQLMPGTAREVAVKLGLRYDLGALTSDWRYNARLGTDYLAGLVAEFGSLPLAAAGYNAGPHRVRQWLDRYGDPRAGAVDMVDWIETIPFSETRNYVQRVMEGLHVYAARLNGAPQPLRLAARLGR